MPSKEQIARAMAKNAGKTIMLPHNWTPWEHQRSTLEALDAGYKRVFKVWHRQAGKDETDLHTIVREMFKRPGNYFLAAPTQKQGRKIYWDKRDSTGIRSIDHAIPEFLRSRKSDQEMIVETIPFGPNGESSTLQVIGYENFDALVGTSPCGVVFTEWAVSDTPEAWDYIEPAIRRSDGIALFNTTPRGMNHAYRLWRSALDDPRWFTSLKTILDTKHPDGRPLVRAEDIEADVAAGRISRQKADTEYYCKFIADVDMVMIQPEWVNDGIERELPKADPNDPLIAGVDVAFGGGDKTRIAFRRGNDARSIPPVVINERDPERLEARIIKELNRVRDVDAVFVDGTGTGITLGRRLQSRLRHCESVVFNAKALDPTLGVENRRTEMYYNLGEWLSDGGCVANDTMLVEELSYTPYKLVTRNGKMCMINKVEIKKTLGRSPDYADALALTFARPVPHKSVARRHRSAAPLMCNGL